MGELIATIDATTTALPEVYNDYSKLEVIKYSNKQEHIYGLTEVDNGDGTTRLKRVHLPGLLTAYGLNTSSDRKAWGLAQEDNNAWQAEREDYLRSRGLWKAPEIEPARADQMRNYGSKIINFARRSWAKIETSDKPNRIREAAYGAIATAAAAGSLAMTASASAAPTIERTSRGLGDRLRSARNRLFRQEEVVTVVQPVEVAEDSAAARISELEQKVNRLEQQHTTEIEQLSANHRAEMKELEDRFETRVQSMNEAHQRELEQKEEIIERQADRIQVLETQLAAGGVSIGERIGQRLRLRNQAARDERRQMTITEIEEERQTDRRYGIGAMAGAVAAAAALAVGGAYLWGEHEEHEGAQRSESPYKVASSDLPQHTVNFNGHNGFKISLPGNLQMRKTAFGYNQIVSNDGKTVVVPHVYWDRQGNLDLDTKKLLKIYNFKLDQKQYPYHTPSTSFDRHYMTVVTNA